MNIKKVFTSFICAVMLLTLCNPSSVSASALSQSANGGQEYFQWNNSFDNNEVNLYASISSIKDFEFEIYASITSSAFTINSTSVSITSIGHVIDPNGDKVTSYNGKEYTAQLTLTSFPWTTKSVTFTVGTSGTKTITGLSSGKNYTVSIINSNMDLASSGYKLVGSGSIN